jgi:hypothetical protein
LSSRKDLSIVPCFIGGFYLIFKMYTGYNKSDFAWAGEQGFVGLAVYFACWVFLAPVMIVGSIIFGAMNWWWER